MNQTTGSRATVCTDAGYASYRYGLGILIPEVLAGYGDATRSDGRLCGARRCIAGYEVCGDSMRSARSLACRVGCTLEGRQAVVWHSMVGHPNCWRTTGSRKAR